MHAVSLGSLTTEEGSRAGSTRAEDSICMRSSQAAEYVAARHWEIPLLRQKMRVLLRRNLRGKQRMLCAHIGPTMLVLSDHVTVYTS